MDIQFIHDNNLTKRMSCPVDVFAFYQVERDSLSIKSLDIQNPTSHDISVKVVNFAFGQEVYNAQPGPSIQPFSGYYGFSPVVAGKSTTTVPISPSGYSGNPANSFPSSGNVMVTIFLLQTQTGMPYKWVQGNIR